MFDKINNWIRNSETSLVNLLSAVAPWLAPLAPAYMSFHHMTEYLGYPVYIALAVAAVVEVLGLSAISTTLAFWSHNKRFKKTEYKKAPTMIVIMSFVFYLAIIIVINVGIDAAKIPTSGLSQDWVVVWARALLTLLSIPAAVILAVRAQHKGLLDGLEEDKRKRQAARATKKKTPAPATNSKAARFNSKKKQQFLVDYESGALQEKLNGLEFTAANIAPLYDTSERNYYRWLSEAKILYKE